MPEHSKETSQQESLVQEADKQQELLNGAGQKKKVKEINGPKGLEPTRYGDWEAKGRCYDF